MIMQIIADGTPGGGTTFVLEMLRSFHSSILVTQKGSYASHVSNVPTYELDFFTSRLDLRIALKLKKIINQIKPKVIHVHGGRAAFFLSFARANHIPIVYTVHGLHGLHQNIPLSKWGQRRAIKKATITVFVSQSEKQLALNHDLIRGANHFVIVNGINTKKLPIRRHFQEKLLGFMGRVTAVKDPLFLLEVMNILGPQGYHLKVIGGGDLEQKMSQSPYVTLTGSLFHEQALQEFVHVERVLIPSIWEGCSLLFLEAMALGIPIIASSIPAFEEIANPGPLATLIPSKDPQKWAAAVLAKNDYTIAAKKHLNKNYLWESCMGAYQAIYDKMQ